MVLVVAAEVENASVECIVEDSSLLVVLVVGVVVEKLSVKDVVVEGKISNSNHFIILSILWMLCVIFASLS
jgi:hypothetical protein